MLTCATFGVLTQSTWVCIKVQVVNTEYHFWICSKKNNSKDMATPWTLINKTNVLLCEVWFPRWHLHALIAEGKNKIYENQAMHTYNIRVWYPGWTSLVEPVQRYRWYLIWSKWMTHINWRHDWENHPNKTHIDFDA